MSSDNTDNYIVEIKHRAEGAALNTALESRLAGIHREFIYHFLHFKVENLAF
ncbi:MAG: hypothetical protein ACRDT5_06085 [Mycobacterium sp.]